MSDRIQVVYIPIEEIFEPEWNPNDQTPEVFNALVANIKEFGMKEPLLVAHRKEGGYWSISGSHRLKAGRVISMKELPCIIEEKFDEDMQKFQNMRFNMIKGKLDPVRFTKLFDEMTKKYGDEATKALMAFTDKAAFEQVYLTAKASLPKDMQKELDKARGEIKTIDGLAAILNEMFAKYGSSLDHGYMVFSYGGQSHLWIIMDDATKKMADTMKKIALETGMNINDVFREMVAVSPEKQK